VGAYKMKLNGRVTGRFGKEIRHLGVRSMNSREKLYKGVGNVKTVYEIRKNVLQ